MLEILREGIRYDPDLVVIYCGHNEFFGAYGVNPTNRAARSPRAMRMQRQINALALVEGLRTLRRPPAEERRTLMERVVDRTHTAPDDPRRNLATANLGRHIEYTYLYLSGVKALHGGLSPEQQAMAGETIRHGGFALAHGLVEPGLTRLFLALLHQYRGEFDDAIALLLAARSELDSMDVLAVDQALFDTYVAMDRIGDARAVAQRGLRGDKRVARFYQELLRTLP